MKYTGNRKYSGKGAIEDHRQKQRVPEEERGYQQEEKNTGELVCEMRRSCGGCQTWNLTYEEEQSMKMATLIGLLRRFGHVEEILSMEDPYHYRNKLQALFQYNGKNQFRYGIYQASTKRIVKCDNCLIENKEAAKIVRSVAHLLTKMQVPAWDMAHKKGVFRHVMVRYAKAEDSYMVALVTGSDTFAAGKDLAAELVKRHPRIKSVVWCKNKTETPIWMDNDGEVLYGSATITDKLAGCLFRISARSFYQVNTTQTEKLYETALAFAELKETDRVVDAYCGIGTIGIAAAKNYGCKEVIAFDNNEAAIRDAKVNARINGLEDSMTFTCADASEMAAELADAGQEVQVMFVDPPRAGCGREMVDAIGDIGPERLVYVSCNPETLAKDLEQLRRLGYKVKKIQPVDMFPRTKHVETVVLMSKK